MPFASICLWFVVWTEQQLICGLFVCFFVWTEQQLICGLFVYFDEAATYLNLACDFVKTLGRMFFRRASSSQWSLDCETNFNYLPHLWVHLLSITHLLFLRVWASCGPNSVWNRVSHSRFYKQCDRTGIMAEWCIIRDGSLVRNWNLHPVRVLRKGLLQSYLCFIILVLILGVLLPWQHQPLRSQPLRLLLLFPQQSHQLRVALLTRPRPNPV